MKPEELAQWWESTRRLIDRLLSVYSTVYNRLSGTVMALELCAYSVKMRDSDAQENPDGWEDARNRIDTALANLIKMRDRMPSTITAIELEDFAAEQRDRPRCICAECAQTFDAGAQHVCERVTSR